MQVLFHSSLQEEVVAPETLGDLGMTQAQEPAEPVDMEVMGTAKVDTATQVIPTEVGAPAVLDSMDKEVHHTFVEVGRRPSKVEERELQKRVTAMALHKAVSELQEASEAVALALVMAAVEAVGTPVVV